MKRLLCLLISLSWIATTYQAAPAPTVYDAGPGFPLAALAQVPWEALNPGDTVNIHPGTYHEKVLFSASGTQALPIKVVGIPDAAGNLPVIDATNATSRLQSVFPYTPPLPTVGTGDRGLFVVTIGKGQSYGTIPSWIQISGLKFRGAYPGVTYTDTDPTKTRTFSTNAAGLWIERGSNVTISGCKFEDNANGFFVSSSDSLTSSGQPAQLSSAITISACEFRGNGVVGDDHEHNSYTEALGLTYQNCTFRPLRAGSNGSALKDRSAGTVIQGCEFELADSGHLLDLVDPEDAPNLLSSAPSFKTTTVSDCYLISTGPNASGSLVHFGGDTGVTKIYRLNLLWNRNLVTVKCDQPKRWRTCVFSLDTNAQSVTSTNSTYLCASQTSGAAATLLQFLYNAGNATFTGNIITAGWGQCRDGVPFTGTFTGTGWTEVPAWK